MIKARTKQGSALILATISVFIICGLIGAMIFIGLSYSNGQKITMAKTQGDSVAIEAVERYRVELYSALRASGLAPRDWLESVRVMRDNGETGYCFPANPRQYSISQLAQRENASAIQHYIAKAWISAISPKNTLARWLEISSETTLHSITIQVTQRLAFDPPPIYDMTLHTGVVNCMCCHLEIHGDVGSLGDFRPGWGSEGTSGVNSARYSRVYGDLYAKGKLNKNNGGLKYALKQKGDSRFNHYFLSGDGMKNLAIDHNNPDLARKVNLAAPFKINGMSFYGQIYTGKEDIGGRLPEDQNADGISEFPVLLPKHVRKNASGRIISAALLWGVPIGNNEENRYNPNDNSQNMGFRGISGHFQGHLVLVGTKRQPIEIEGAVVADGDIVLKGYIKGRGVLYSGRNIYIAGDLVYKNPPQCYWRLPKERRIDAAKEDILNGTDELRLAARSNIVIGDWTYKYPSGRKFPVANRQSYGFYRQQFNLEKNGYFCAGDFGISLELIAKNGSYYNDNGEKITALVVTVTGDSYYDYIFTPSLLKANGALFVWMNGQQYRALLGKENFAYSNWRGKFSGAKSEILKELCANGFSENDAKFIWQARSGGYDRGTWMFHKSGAKSCFTLRVVLDAKRPQPFQVGRIDAFLCAHKRIAGKTSGKNLVINGGLIAEQLGILAPGHRRFFWMGKRYRQVFAKISGKHPSYGKYNNRYHDGRGGRWGVMTINYDYRIKSGGEGFDLLEGTLARRIFIKKSYRHR